MNLFKHQKEAVEFAIVKKGNCAIFHEMGLGKTRTAIEIFKNLKIAVPGLKMLVIAPLSLLDAAWGEDIKRFSSFTAENLHDDFSLSDKADIYLINYESMLSDFKTRIIELYAGKNPIFCVLDESSRMKNFKAKTTKTLLRLRDKFRFRIVMSGTPAPNCETEYWAQMEFVRPGILHPSFYAFRNTYFHLERNGQKIITQGGFINAQMAREMFSKGFKYEITPAKRQDMMNRIKPVCHFAKKIDCLDLPEQLDEIRTVNLGAVQRKIYNELKRDLITEIANTPITAQAALTKIMKLREITSGFAFDVDGQPREIGESPKLDELESVAVEAGNQQMIIWANFHWEIRKIRDRLAPLGRVVTLYAETEDRNESIRDFLDGRARFLVAHPRSAAHGLTFVNTSLEVFFSLDYSWEAYEQSRARTHRAGQFNPCTYIHVLAKDTIDEAIFQVLKKKQGAQEIIYKLISKKTELQRVG